MNRKAVIIVVTLASLVVTSAAGAQMLRSNYDEPAFDLVHRTKPFELRTYQTRVVAETTVGADTLRAATSEGFSRLAGYIFGKNRTPEGDSSKIAMTTPVESVPSAEGEFTVTFTMPTEYSLADLPRPRDARIRLRELPAQMVAIVRFGGVARNKDVSELKRELLAYVERRGYRAASPVTVAQYDPPWIPGFLRRNELMVVVTPGGAHTQ